MCQQGIEKLRADKEKSMNFSDYTIIRSTTADLNLSGKRIHIQSIYYNK